MRHVALTLMAPIRDGREAAVRAAVAGLPDGPASPFAGVPGLHMGRVTIVDRLEDPGARDAPPVGPFLYLVVDADPPLDGVLVAVGRACGALFSHCEGCPDPDDERELGRWLRRHRIKDSWTIMPYADRSLDEVRGALALRERFGAFAAREAAVPGDEGLRERFLAEFG